MITSLQI